MFLSPRLILGNIVYLKKNKNENDILNLSEYMIEILR